MTAASWRFTPGPGLAVVGPGGLVLVDADQAILDDETLTVLCRAVSDIAAAGELANLLDHADLLGPLAVIGRTQHGWNVLMARDPKYVIRMTGGRKPAWRQHPAGHWECDLGPADAITLRIVDRAAGAEDPYAELGVSQFRVSAGCVPVRAIGWSPDAVAAPEPETGRTDARPLVLPPAVSDRSAENGSGGLGAAQGQPMEVPGVPDRLWLRLSDGQVLELGEHAVVGVAPVPERRSCADRTQLVTLLDPTGVVAASHIAIRREEQRVTVRDLYTTHGTELLNPGRGTVQVDTDHEHDVQPGGALLLGRQGGPRAELVAEPW